MMTVAKSARYPREMLLLPERGSGGVAADEIFTDLDFAGYNVYRHEPGSAPEKLNTEPLKTPAYRDTAVSSGRGYSYSVSSVDGRGNESARSEEASESVP